MSRCGLPQVLSNSSVFKYVPDANTLGLGRKVTGNVWRFLGNSITEQDTPRTDTKEEQG